MPGYWVETKLVMSSLRYPVTMVMGATPALIRLSSARPRMVLPPISTRALWQVLESGSIRRPRPAARITACICLFLSCDSGRVRRLDALRREGRMPGLAAGGKACAAGQVTGYRRGQPAEERTNPHEAVQVTRCRVPQVPEEGGWDHGRHMAALARQSRG